jgi:hypothetical protein
MERTKKNQYGLTTGQCELEKEWIWSVQKKTNMVSQLDNVSCPQGEMERETTMERKQNL